MLQRAPRRTSSISCVNSLYNFLKTEVVCHVPMTSVFSFYKNSTIYYIYVYARMLYILWALKRGFWCFLHKGNAKNKKIEKNKNIFKKPIDKSEFICYNSGAFAEG